MTERSPLTIDIWHAHDGRIIAWGRPVANAPIALRTSPIPTDDGGVISVEVAEKQLMQLHETHFVDVAKSSLEAHPDKAQN